MSKRAILDKKANLIHKFTPLKNWAKYLSLLTIFTLGFLLIPNTSYACAKNVREMAPSSCSKKQDQHSPLKDLTKDKSCEKENQHKACDDQCKHSSCGCGTSAPSFGLHAVLTLHTKNHPSERTKQRFFFKHAHYSSGYFSVWLPPKIS